MTNKYIVLGCGLNIRDHNRITINEQRLALEAVVSEHEARPVSEKGSSPITSRHDGERVVAFALGALAAHHPSFTIAGE